jgi:hypothetical protein
MPERIKLHRGGQLIRTPWEQDSENPEEFTTEDVSSQAALYLLEPVALDVDLRLIDVFALLRKDETLQYIFSRDLAREFIAAAFKLEAAPYPAPYNPEGLEYLVLYNQWARDTTSNVLRGADRLEFSGMGFVLKEDNNAYGPGQGAAGSRLRYSVSLRPVKELLNLPLRYLPEVIIHEDNEGSDAYWEELDKVTVEAPTLGLVIQSIFSELSEAGTPGDVREKYDEVMGLAAEAKSLQDGQTEPSLRGK